MNAYCVAETATAIWSYHLRLVDSAKKVALCGKPVGWDTEIPVSSWGVRDHIPSRWCSECKAIFDLQVPRVILVLDT